MNREQIIKMLETIDEVGDCSRDCIFYNGKVHSCGGTIAKHALALIKELTEENEFHRKTISENAQMALEVTFDEIEKVKVDTVQKMQEKLLYEWDWCSYDADEAPDVINRVAKEMLED